MDYIISDGFKRGYYEWRIPEINFQGFIINREIRQRFLIMELENKEKEIIKGGGLWGYLYLLRMLKLLLKGLIINLLKIIIIILLTGINIALLMG
ncbi:MAG: hypothetical protein ABIK59_05875, partial [candidate division WOR-3 bacterium]